MNFIKKYKAVIALLIPVLILILFRLAAPGHFKVNAKKWAGPSFERSNLITGEMLKTIPGDKLLINLSKENTTDTGIEKTVRTDPDSLLLKIDAIKEHEGPVILFSSETAVSARVWMVLSQMGYDNIYILSDEEVLKYKFRPDTTKPEL